jgi:hypothetical protein
VIRADVALAISSPPQVSSGGGQFEFSPDDPDNYHREFPAPDGVMPGGSPGV